MYVAKKVDMKKNLKFNLAGHTVNIYVEEDFRVEENSNVTANVYSQKHIHVDGKKGAATTTYMKGLFIGEKVDGHDNVVWSWNTNCNPAPIPNDLLAVANDDDDDDDDDNDDHRVANPTIVSDVYPNPFSDKATIVFTLGEKNPTVIEVVSLTGVRVEVKDLGELEALIEHTVVFTPSSSMASGTYIYRIISGNNVSTGRMIFIK
jgi:hypothetical protein